MCVGDLLFEFVVCLFDMLYMLYWLLGGGGVVGFWYYCDNLLLYDLIVVDEVLMIDVVFVVYLFDVFVLGVWFVLLGDKD